MLVNRASTMSPPLYDTRLHVRVGIPICAPERTTVLDTGLLVQEANAGLASFTELRGQQHSNLA